MNNGDYFPGNTCMDFAESIIPQFFKKCYNISIKAPILVFNCPISDFE